MSTESRLRGVLAGLLLFLAASGAFTWTQSRPALAIQFVELAHAAAGLIVIVLGIAYVAVHLAQTLAAPERAARKSTRKPILAVRALFGGTWLAPDQPFQAKKLAALALAVALAVAYIVTHGPYTAGHVRALFIGGGIVALLAAVRVVGLGRAASLAIGLAGVLVVFVLIAVATGSNAPRVLVIGVGIAAIVLWAVARSTGNVTRTPGGLGGLAMLTCLVAAIGGAGTAFGLMLYARVPGLEKLPIPWFVHVSSSWIALVLVLAHVRSARTRAARLANPARRAYPWSEPLRRAAAPTFVLAILVTAIVTIAGSARVGRFESDDDALAPMGAGFSVVLPAACDSCHVDVVYGWSRSSHARAAANPLFTAMLRQLRDQRGPEEVRVCLRCHAPHARDPVGASFDAVVESEGYRAGVHCVSCHRTTPAGDADGALTAKPLGADGFSLLIERPGLGEHLDRVPGARRLIQNTLVSSRLERHRERYRFAIHDASSCRPCHVQTLGPSTHGRMTEPLQDQYSSWRTSPAADAGITCTSCHMTHYQRAYGTPVHDHRFLAASTYVAAVGHGEEGVSEVVAALSGHTPLPPAGREPFDEQALAAQRPPQATPGPLLVMEAELADDALVIRTRNSGQIGHAFPSGPTDLFQVWLSARATDAAGRIVLEVGANGPDGAPQLGHRLRDAAGEPIHDHRLHAVHEVVELGRIPVVGNHEVRLDRSTLACDPTADGCSFHVEAAWNYRRLDPALVERIVGAPGPTLPIVRVGEVVADLAVGRPS